jgi:tRNA U34 5-methylaminomethyl-2-thiouridine-forming methyltransferase MnmC
MAEPTAAEKKAAADQAAADEAAKKSSKATKVVKYIGTSDIREIDAASFAQVGVKEQKKLVFDRSNGWKQDNADGNINADALAYFENDDDGFVVIDAD